MKTNHAVEERSTSSTVRVEATGTCDPQFREVQDVLETQLNTGQDVGASAAVFIDGEPVVDIFGGYADETRTRPWTRDTIVNNFSTTKTMTALCALILADRRELDLNAPVVKYWPEFAAEGKSQVLVRHFLGHSAGLPGWTEPVTLADVLDREKSSSLLAAQAPWWEPGTMSGYHAITYGPLIGEVVRRVTGKTLTAFFADEVAGPLGADYQIGVRPEDDHRVSNMIQSAAIRPRSGAETIMDRVFFNPYVTPQSSGTVAWRRGELGGSNGHGNARSVALVQTVLACGGEVGGVRLLSTAGCERALEVVSDGLDHVMGYDVRWGAGYAVDCPTLNVLFGNIFAGRRVACWGGSGGSFVINDLDARMTVAYVMNRHVEHGGTDARSIAIVRAAYDSARRSGRLKDK
jgi:CubicO group peptidase (beta-lactamase class C family)